MTDVVPAGTWVTCPHCRLYSDGLANPTPKALELPCPWCGRRDRAERWAKCAAETACESCAHPSTLHVCYYTSDGEPPRPGVAVSSSPSSCSACGCRPTNARGAREVRPNG